MRFLSLPSITLTLMFTAPVVSAQTPNMLFKGAEAVLAYKETLNIEVIDQVNGNCLSDPEALETASRAALEKAGFDVLDEPKPLGDTVVINTLGYEVGEGKCVLYLDAWLNHWLVANVPYAGKIEGGGEAYIATRHNLGQTLHYTTLNGSSPLAIEAAKRFANRLKADVDQSRAFVERNFPAIQTEHQRIKETQGPGAS